jgi:hypothetical protein
MDGVNEARGRLLQTFRSGDWERVDAQADAYGAAVRAEERRRTIDLAVEAIERAFDDGLDRTAAEWRQRCLDEISALY